MKHKNKWNKKLAMKIAIKEKIILTHISWQIIFFIRQQIFIYNIKPTYQNIINYLIKKNNILFDTNDLFKLFPKGLSTQAFKIAGVKIHKCL